MVSKNKALNIWTLKLSLQFIVLKVNVILQQNLKRPRKNSDLY